MLSFAPGTLDTAMQAEIRATDLADFPRRERFRELHAEGRLIDPALPAAWVCDWLEAEQVAPLTPIS